MKSSTNTQLSNIEFLRAFARANNAIEGVVLSNKDKVFMDNIDLQIDKQAFKILVLNHIKSKSN